MRSLLFALIVCSTVTLGALETQEAPKEESLVTPQALAERGLGDDVLVAPPGDLVLWDAETGHGFLLHGESGQTEVTEFHGPASPRLAVSPRGAWAFSTNGDRTVEIHRPDGTNSQLEIGYPVGGMAWLDERRLALGPLNGDYEVELWDTESSKLLRGIGAVSRISEAPGYRLLRNTELAWDSKHHRLHTLDAFAGRYRVYDLSDLAEDGPVTTSAKPVIESQIDDRNRGLWEERLAAVDRELVERGEFQGASIWRFSPALDTDGTAWMVERCDEGKKAHLLAVDAKGAEYRVAVETSCCSTSAVPWGELLAFVRSARPDLPGCFVTLPRPRLEESSIGAFWLEATPLSRGAESDSRSGNDGPAVLERFPPGTEPGAVLDRLSVLGAGLNLVCTGGEQRPIDCKQLWLDRDKPPDDPAFEELSGRRVTGRVTLGDVGLDGVSVALVPADFKTTRLLTLPLALPAGAPKPVREIETDLEGRFTLPLLAPGDYRLLLGLPGGRMDYETTFTVTVPRRSGKTGAATDRDVLDLGELSFPAGISVEVVVTDSEGQPVPHALAGAAQALAGQEQNPGAVTLFQADAAEDGRAVISGLAPDRPVRFSCQAPGHDGWRAGFDVPPTYVGCVLAPLAKLSGRVVGEDGEPLPAVLVTISGGSPLYGPLTRTARLEADDDSRFQFEDLEAAQYRLVASGPGLEAKVLSLTLEPGEVHDLGELVLEPGERWILRVVDGSEDGQGEGGKPVAGATVAAVFPPESLVPATTDSWGEAEIESPAVGPLRIEVRATGFATRRVDVPESARTPNKDPHEVVLEHGGWIEVHVWDESSGEPCAGCQINLHGGGPAQDLVTDGSGTARSEPLASGVWQASLAQVQGYGGMVTRSGGNDVRRVTVRPGRTTEVHFGDPVETLSVVLSPPPGDSGAWKLVVLDVAGSSKLYRLDNSGSATIRRPKGGGLLSLTDGRVTIEVGTLPEDANNPALVELFSGLLTARLPSHLGGASPGDLPVRLELVDPSNGRRVAEAQVSAGDVIRIPFLSSGNYELRSEGRSLGAASVVDGRETYLGGLE